MRRTKEEKKKNIKRNAAIIAGSLATLGVGAALISRNKQSVGNVAKSTATVAKNAPNITPTPSQLGGKPSVENAIGGKLDPVDLARKNVTIGEALQETKKVETIWDKVGEKLRQITPPDKKQKLLPGAKQPKGLLRPGYDTPDPWNDVDPARSIWGDIGDKVSAKKQGILSGQQPKGLLNPGGKISVDVGIQGYTRGDGTFVRGHQRQINKSLEKDVVEKLEQQITSDPLTSGVSRNRPSQVWGKRRNPETQAAIEKQLQEANRSAMENSVATVQANTVKSPIVIDSGDITPDASVSESAKQRMKNRYTNSDYHDKTTRRLDNDARDLARQLEEETKQKILKESTSFNTNYEGLKKSVQDYEPDIFSNKTQQELFVNNVETDISTLEKRLRNTLDDPFADDYFADNKDRINSVKQKLGEKIGLLDDKLKEPERLLQQTTDTLSQIETLKKRYKDELAKTYQANSGKVEALKQQLQTEYETLQNLTREDVLDGFYRSKDDLAEGMRRRAVRQNFDVSSSYERKLNDLRSKVKNLQTTAKSKVKQPQDELLAQRAQLLSLVEKVDSLPQTKRNLTRAQKTQLKQTEAFPKTAKKLYGDLITNIEELHKYEKDFGERFLKASDNLESHIKDVFSNTTYNEYIEGVEEGVVVLSNRYPNFNKANDLIEQLYEPDSYLNKYVELINHTDVDTQSTLVPFGKDRTLPTFAEIMTNKKVVMQGGYIGGEKRQGIMDELKVLYNASRIKGVLTNARGDLYIGGKLYNLTADEATLAKLSNEYLARKSQLLRNIDNSMTEIAEKIDVQTLSRDPNVGAVIGKIDDTVKRYRNEFGNDDISSSFFKQRTAIEDARDHLAQLSRVKPQYEWDEATNMPVLRGIINTDKPIRELNKEVIDTMELDYNRSLGRTQSRRLTTANLYNKLDNAGIKVEGKDNFFKRLKMGDSNLGDSERQYMKSLTTNERVMLRNFAKSDSHETFQQYYYTNSMSYVLRGKTEQSLDLPSDVGVQTGMYNDRLMSRIKQMAIGSDKPNSLIQRKFGEVRTAIRDLNSLGEDVKLAPYMLDKEGNKLFYQNGQYGVVGLPPELPGEQYRKRNFMVKKLRKLLGVTSSGTPLYNPRMAQIMSGAGVKNREDLAQLISDINVKHYKTTDLNSLYVAERINHERMRDYDANLYLYNFSTQSDVLNMAYFNNV